MAQSYRRIIKRPVDVEDGDWSRLEELLGRSIERQNEFASSSPHVLRFLGGLQPLPDGQGWFIEHEAATAMPIGGLFDRSASAVHEAELLRITVAIYDALRAAHSAEGQGRAVHGAVSPGVILFAPDGTVKLADFGFAPAICSVLGEDAFRNLCIGPVDTVQAASGQEGDQASGVWEVLVPDEYERDGRVCAFIDPEKYGTDALSAFEPVADIIAAAFVLHLLAEHQHPYLPDDPTAHRVVEMSELMAMARFNGARRSDLRESTNPGVVLWCEFIGNALARLPQGRPSATQIVDALREHVRPDDEGDVIRRRLESLDALARDKAWAQLEQEARNLAAHKTAPADVVQRANSLAVQAAANLLVDKAGSALQGPNWRESEDLIETALAMPGLPADLAAEARQMRDSVEASIRAGDALDEIESRIKKDDGADPFATVELAQALIDRVGKIKDGRSVIPQVRTRVEGINKELTSRLEAALPAANAAMAANRELAKGWVKRLEAAMADEQWESLEKLLSDRPDLAHWPEDTQALADAARRKLDDHRKELERQEAIQADHSTARLWADQLRLAVDAGKWDRAKQLLEDKPSLPNWPEGLEEEVDGLAESIQQASKKQSDEREARQWCARIREAVEQGDFAAGAEVLSARPALQHWPADVLDEVRRYERQLQSWTEAAERKREEEAEQQHRIDEWLDRASLAAKNEQWEEALEILAAQPTVDLLPDEAIEQAAKLAESCRTRIAARSQDQFKGQVQAVEAVAREFVRRVVTEQFDQLLHPDSIDVWLEAVALTPERLAGDLQVNVRPRFADSEEAPDESETTITFHFRIDPTSRRIRQEESLRGQLANNLKDLLTKLQRWSLTQLTKSVQERLFPKAEITVVPGEPTASLPATVRLLGPESARGCVETEIAWDRGELAWDFSRPAEFIRQGLSIAVETIARALEERLLDDTVGLKNYRLVLGVEVSSRSDANLRELPADLRLEGSIVIRPGGPVEPRTLQKFPVACRQVHDIQCDVDLAPTIAELGKVVLAAQRAHWSEIKTELQERIRQSGLKAKLKTDPNRLDGPVAKVGFHVQAKGRDALELLLHWDASSFKFTFPDAWKQSLDRCLPLPAGKGAKPAARPTATLPVRALVGLVVLIVLSIWLWPKGGSSPEPLKAIITVPDNQYSEGAKVPLDGSNSSGPDRDRLTYLWRLGGTPPVPLSQLDIVEGEYSREEDVVKGKLFFFTAPQGISNMEFSFELEVSDGEDSDRASVHIVVEADNDPPIADAGSNFLADAGDLVKLDATGSSDPEKQTLTYSWMQKEGPEVSLQGANTAQAEFTAPRTSERTSLTFEIQVSDGSTTLTDSVTIHLGAEPVPADPCVGLKAEFIRLVQDFEPVERQLESKSHEALLALWRDNALDEVISRSGRLADQVDRVDAQDSPVCVTLSGDIKRKREQVSTWNDKLFAYGAAFEIDQQSVTEQIRLLQAAQGAFATEFVDALMPKLQKAVGLYESATQKIDQDWRAAMYFLHEAERQADTPDLKRRLASSIEGGRNRLHEVRRESIGRRLEEAKKWLASVNRPAKSVYLLDLKEEPTEARRWLDDLDLNHGVQSEWPERCRSIWGPELENQSSFLTADEKSIIQDLENWVTVSLVLKSEGGAPQDVVVFMFIPEAHEMGIDPFWISQTEITVGQYKAVEGRLPSDKMLTSDEKRKAHADMKSDDTHPVAFLPAMEVNDFCKSLGQRLGNGLVVRLPRPREWKYALYAGAGNMTGSPQLCTYGRDGRVKLDPRRFNCESDENYAFSAPGHNDCFGWYAPVGSYPPNRWLLYDMIGNVSEWVSETPGADPKAIGSSFLESAEEPNNHTRMSRRDPDGSPEDVGLRVILQPSLR